MSGENHSAAGPRIESLDLAKVMSEKPADLDLVLPGMIAGTVGSIVAPGGTGKSWLALQIAVAIAGGPDFADIGVPSCGDVLYLPAEDPTSALVHRLHALGQHSSNEERDAMASRLRVAPLIGQVVDVFDSAWRDTIAREAAGSRLVILDTIRRFHTRDENSSGEMAELLGILEGICVETGTSILFVHHVGKGADGSTQAAARGSSVLVDNVRGGQWNLLKATLKDEKELGPGAQERFVRLVQSKTNFGPQMSTRWLQRTNEGILVSHDVVEDVGNGEASRKTSRGRRVRARG